MHIVHHADIKARTWCVDTECHEANPNVQIIVSSTHVCRIYMLLAILHLVIFLALPIDSHHVGLHITLLVR